MNNYLSVIKKPFIEVSDDVSSIMDMIPANLCPFAYHNLIPYIITLFNQGWFRWVKKEKDVNKRYPVSKNLFEDTASVNRKFPNEVLVCCPNPFVSVVFAVGLNITNRKKTITLRILNKKGSCFMGHNEGDKFEISEEDIKFPPETFNVLFPYILLCGYKENVLIRCQDTKAKMIFSIYQNKDIASYERGCIVSNGFKAKITEIKFPCRYHSKLTEIKRIAPNNMCIDGFHAIYPYSLALLYDATFTNDLKKDLVYINCPSTEGKVIFEVKRILTGNNTTRLLKTFSANIFEMFFYPVDFFSYKIVYTVSQIKGKCPAGYNIGDEFTFNISDRDELCPASFHSISPYLFLKNKGVFFGWEGTDNSSQVSCPDCQGAVYKF